MLEGLEKTSLQEFHVHLENTIIRLLIGETWNQGRDEAVIAHILHTHTCSELFVCGTGEVILKTEDGYLTLQAGDAANIPPGVHHIKYHTAPGTEGYALNFLCIRKNTRDCTDLYKIFSPFVDSNRILVWRKQFALFAGVQKIIRESESSCDFTLALHMAELLIKAVGMPVDLAETTNAVEQETISRFNDMQRILQLDQLIETYYMQDWKIDNYAEQLYISSRQLARIVQKRYGKTLHEVIMDKRVLVAERLLTTTDNTVDKIALTVGFSSSAGFYREFARHYETTPAEYRRRLMETTK